MPNPEALDRIGRMLAKAKERLEAMTPDQRTHHRHEQRISFAAGNVAMSWPVDTINGEPALEVTTRLVRQQAGSCPCGDCTHVRERRGSVERGGACVLYASGEAVSGEVES